MLYNLLNYNIAYRASPETMDKQGLQDLQALPEQEAFLVLKLIFSWVVAKKIGLASK
jgi:hypothetical protein